MVSFTIEIEPIGKGRPRLGRGGARTPEKTRVWCAAFAMMARQYRPAEVLRGPLRVDIDAVFTRPSRLHRKADPDGLIWKDTRPDKDNVEKAVLDALSEFWVDDAQAVCGETRKFYAERDGVPRVSVRITCAGAPVGLVGGE